jgi:hypothetical protein
LRGNGNGTFQPPREIVVGSGTAKISVGDFNRDGIKDLGLASDSSRVYILIGAGDGTFIQQPTLTPRRTRLGLSRCVTDIVMVAELQTARQSRTLVRRDCTLNGSRTAILIGTATGIAFSRRRSSRKPSSQVCLIVNVQQAGPPIANGRRVSGFLALSLGWGTQGL